MTASLVFVVVRHVNSVTTNVYWQECYRSIRKWYPSNLIVFIDDYSLSEFLSEPVVIDENTLFIQSNCPKGCGEFLGYYYFYKYKWADFAVVLHDSFWIQKPIPTLEEFLNTPESKVKCLLHFCTRWNHHNFGEEMQMIRQLKDPSDLVEYFHNLELCNIGFFGIQSCISHDFLHLLQKRFQLMNIVHLVTTRDKRMCLERVFAALCSFMHRELLQDPSLYGELYGTYIHKYELTDYSFYLENIVAIRSQDRPFIKIFTGR